FNARFTFSAPGTKTFGFQQFDGVQRTYYADSLVDHNWADISNSGSQGVPDSIVIGNGSGLPPLADDTLYAIPAQANAAAGAPVQVTVTTGKLANPFHYLTAIGLTAPSD